MRFVRGENNHSDGEGGVLGRGFYPRFGGDIYFDDEENWSLDLYYNSNNKHNLLHVAIHELGHALGLEHSEKSTAIMFPTYGVGEGEVKLDADDVLAIQALYGAQGQSRPHHDDMEEVDIETGNSRYFSLF